MKKHKNRFPLYVDGGYGRRYGRGKLSSFRKEGQFNIEILSGFQMKNLLTKRLTQTVYFARLQKLGGYGGDYYGGGYGGYGRNVSVTHCLFQFGLDSASQLPIR